MSTGGNKSKGAHEKAQQVYLEAGRKYSGLLKNAMDMDPNIVKIAEEILVIGDKISVHDNKLLTRFYNELLQGSKVDKQYYELLIGLKKAKNELDIATDRLLSSRVGKILSEAGIPPKESNLSASAMVGRLNNPDISFLEKIALPGVLPLELASELEQLVASSELTVAAGRLSPKTRTAKEFLKKAEKEIRQRANDDYLLGKGASGQNIFSDIIPTDILGVVKVAADADHIREIERRVDSGDIGFTSDGLRALTPKGTRYLGLLSEELLGLASKKADDTLIAKNQAFLDNDSRLARSKKAVDSLHESLRKHDRFSGLTEGTVYGDLIARAKKHKEEINTKMSRLMADQETISRSFVSIKKRIISVASQTEVDVPGLLSLLVASRHLAKFETDYHRHLLEIESILGVNVPNGDIDHAPVAGHILAEDYCSHGCLHFEEASSLVKELVLSRIQGRKDLSEQMEKVLTDFVLSPKEVESLRTILCEQNAIKRHISDIDYAGGSLYQGIGGLSSLIEELVELEVEKRERIADFIHEFELAHKELWLASIKNSNKNFISENFPDLKDDIKKMAAENNNLLVASVRGQVKEVIAKYRDDHQTSSQSFGKQLKSSLDKLKVDGDVAAASASLKSEYKKMVSSHDQALSSLEIEIGLLERKLAEFESGSKKDLEKALISDIRKNI